MPDILDDQLSSAREALQRQISVPDLDRVRTRARRLRRRRSALVATAAAAVLALVAGLGALVTGPGTGPGPQPGTPTSTGPEWHGNGITVHGLDGPVLELPGSLVDVQFTDADHGFALSAECVTPGACVFGFAVTSDGGHAWTKLADPPVQATVPRLVVVSTGAFLVTPAGATFQPTGDAPAIPVTPTPTGSIPTGALPRLAGDGCGAPIDIFEPDGRSARLTAALPITVCAPAVRPAADGAWWFGGRTPDGAAPAVAVSRDDGRTWTVTRLPDGPGTAAVTTLGNRAFAAVLTGGPDARTVEAVYRSVDSGPFQPYLAGPVPVAGDVVPLLDGRLLAAGPDWLVSSTTGGALARTTGTLPWIARIVRTPGAYVAYDLFRGGWVAVSTDGETWHKLNLH